jgi:hypothetical protein
MKMDTFHLSINLQPIWLGIPSYIWQNLVFFFSGFNIRVIIISVLWLLESVTDACWLSRWVYTHLG